MIRSRFYLVATLVAIIVGILPTRYGYAQGPATISVTPSTGAAGTPITVTIANGPGNRGDWVALYPVGAGNSGYGEWKYLNGLPARPTTGQTAATLTFTLPSGAGDYNLRFFGDDSYVLLATSQTLTVTGNAPATTIDATPLSGITGQAITVTIANGPGNRGDWVALYPISASNSGYGEWKYLSGLPTPPATGLHAATLTFTLPSVTGAYNLRVFADDSYTLLATSQTITVTPATSIGVTPLSGTGGQPITVMIAGGPGNRGDWIGLYPTGAGVSGYGEWKYLNGLQTRPATGQTAATLTFTLPSAAGTYNLRIFADDSYSLLSTSANVTVVPAPASVNVTPPSGATGDTISATVLNGPGTRGDWIALYSESAGNSAYSQWKYLNGLQTPPATGLSTATVTFTLPSTPGSYNLRLFANDSYALLATSATVAASSPALTAVAPPTVQQGDTAVAVALTGQYTHFAAGTTTASFGAGITVNSVTVIDSTHAAASVTVAPTATVGTRDVTVTTGSEMVTHTNGFTILAGTPVLTTVNPVSAQQGDTAVSVQLTGLYTHFAAGVTTANFGAGITMSGVTVTDATHATATVTLAPTATLGARDVSVTTGSEVVTRTNGFTVLAGTPVLTTVSLANAQQGDTAVSVQLTGLYTHFSAGTTSATFGADITVAGVSVMDATHATATITIAPTATIGTRDVIVTTGSEVVTRTNGFTVLAGTPVLATVSPTSAQQGDTSVSLQLTGLYTHFAAGTSSVSVGAGITVNAVTVTDATHATANVTVAPTATMGTRDVTVTTGAEIVTRASSFTVLPGTPVVTTVSPVSAQQGDAAVSVQLTGLYTHFAAGTSSASFGADITVNSVTITDATHATANVTVAPTATIGARDVTVTTSGEVVTRTSGFTVLAGTPVLTTVSPVSAQQGDTNLNVLFTGAFTHFATGTTAASFGAGITVNSTTVNDATHARANITVEPTATLGARDVTVTTGGEVVTQVAGFSVLAGIPALTDVSPASAQQGDANLNVLFTGVFTNFAAGTTVASFGAGITVNSTTVSDPTHARANITVAGGATLGARDVTVTTGGEVVTQASGFTVLAGVPVLTDVSPLSAQQGDANLNVLFTGVFTHFSAGTTTAGFGAGITVNSTTVTDATHARASITIAPNATLGVRDVVVTTGGEVVTRVAGFTILAGVPTLTDVSPVSAQQGDANLNVLFTGVFTHFANGTTTANFGAGITVNSTTVTDPTHARANITVAGAATPGPRSVIVTTGAEVVTQAAGFTVVLDSTSPSAPAGLVATAASWSRIDLSWSTATDNVGVTGYKVFRDGNLIGSTTTASYSDMGLAASTLYAYEVAAFDLAGNNGPHSTTAFATTQPLPDTQAPTVPTGLTGLGASPTQINLTWTASSDNIAVTGYTIYRNSVAVGTSATNTFSDTGLSPSTMYSYAVSAFDAAANASEQSATANVATLAASPQPVFPLGSSTNGRYLVDQNNVPFLMVGDSPQALIGDLSETQAEAFLADRQAHGFNTLWVNLLCNNYTGCHADGSTFDGIQPFTTPGDLSTPNNAYFARADAIIQRAANHGILMLLDPIETGGWLDILTSNGQAKARAFGQYLGNRYKNFDNIIWMSGNDYNDWAWTNPYYDDVVRAVALGILDTDTRHIHTLELGYPVSGSSQNSAWQSIISLATAYTYYTPYSKVLDEYNQPIVKPVFMVEASYEFEGYFGNYGDPSTLRRQEYWTMLSGATGQLYGNHYTWQFIPDWEVNLDTTGVTQFGFLKTLLGSRPWYNLVPDQNHSVVTAGYGTYSSSSTVAGNDYATTARTPDGHLVMTYLPTVRTITVDMTKLSGPVTARWFDPTTGSFQAIGGSPFANTGTRQFTPSATNGEGVGDWVLVLEAN